MLHFALVINDKNRAGFRTDIGVFDVIIIAFSVVTLRRN